MADKAGRLKPAPYMKALLRVKAFFLLLGSEIGLVGIHS